MALQEPLILIMIPVGLLFTIVGVRGVRRTRWLSRHGDRAEAVIVGQRVSNGEKGKVYAPRVEFTTGDGRCVEVTSKTSGSRSERSKFATGRQVTVYYDPRDPTKAAIKGYDGEAEWAFAIVGVLMLVIPTAVFLLDVVVGAF